jgi:hypothetical protein
MWHASWQIKTKGGIRDEAVDATVREFELRNTPGMSARQVRLLKGERGVASFHRSEPVHYPLRCWRCVDSVSAVEVLEQL